jgi:hypothetical protein
VSSVLDYAYRWFPEHTVEFWNGMNWTVPVAAPDPASVASQCGVERTLAGDDVVIAVERPSQALRLMDELAAAGQSCSAVMVCSAGPDHRSVAAPVLARRTGHLVYLAAAAVLIVAAVLALAAGLALGVRRPLVGVPFGVAAGLLISVASASAVRWRFQRSLSEPPGAAFAPASSLVLITVDASRSSSPSLPAVRAIAQRALNQDDVVWSAWTGEHCQGAQQPISRQRP